MLPEDHKKYMFRFKNSDILDTILSVKEKKLEATRVTNGFSLLANVSSTLDKKEENIDGHFSVSLQDFRHHLPNLLELTANGINKNTSTLVHHVDKMAIAPGRNPKS